MKSLQLQTAIAVATLVDNHITGKGGIVMQEQQSSENVLSTKHRDRDPEPTQEETPYSIARAKLRWGNNKAHSSKTKRVSKAKIANASKKRNRK